VKRVVLLVAGTALVIAAVFGLIFSIAGVVVVGQAVAAIEVSLNSGLELMDRTLQTTADGLSLADESLEDVQTAVSSLESTIRQSGTALGNVIPSFRSLGDLLGLEVPGTLRSTEQSLGAASQAAEVIDNLLNTLSSIPFLNIATYAPEVPFHESLQDVASNIQDIPGKLEAAQQGITDAIDNLETIKEDVTTIADPIGRIGTSLGETQGVLANYQGIVGDLQQQVTNLQNNVSTWLNWLKWGVWLILIWLGIAQIGLFTQGLELIGRGRALGATAAALPPPAAAPALPTSSLPANAPSNTAGESALAELPPADETSAPER
jgi:methyl-accepting chemotaxis protein